MMMHEPTPALELAIGTDLPVLIIPLKETARIVDVMDYLLYI
jgi:hypothetical protein